MMNPDNIQFLSGGLKYFSGSPPWGASVRKRPPTGLSAQPKYLHVVYISIRDDKLIAQHEEGPIDPTDLDTAEDEFIEKAIRDPDSRDFELITFKEPSYFTIVLDADGWEFYYPDPASREPHPGEIHDPIAFMQKKTVIQYNSVSRRWERKTRDGKENWSFYNLKHKYKNIRNNTRHAVQCINYLARNAAGDPLNPGENQDFSFNILIAVPFYGSSKAITLIVDPDGQNQGPPPPAPPPPLEG